MNLNSQLLNTTQKSICTTDMWVFQKRAVNNQYEKEYVLSEMIYGGELDGQRIVAIIVPKDRIWVYGDAFRAE